MRLIDADALINKLKRNSIFEKITDSRGMNTIEIIEEQPTAYYVGNEYNKAIDDFAEMLCEKVESFTVKVEGIEVDILSLDYLTEFVFEIAEQLKG